MSAGSDNSAHVRRHQQAGDLCGIGGVVQDGRETVIRPGAFALYDTTRPYELKFDDAFTQTIFKVPREMLQRRLGGTDAGDRGLDMRQAGRLLHVPSCLH